MLLFHDLGSFEEDFTVVEVKWGGRKNNCGSTFAVEFTGEGVEEEITNALRIVTPTVRLTYLEMFDSGW